MSTDTKDMFQQMHIYEKNTKKRHLSLVAWAAHEQKVVAHKMVKLYWIPHKIFQDSSLGLGLQVKPFQLFRQFLKVC